MNYFDLFEMPVSINIDKTLLTKKYVELQKKYHPDFFTQENEAAQDDALEISSAINKAMKVFKKPDATLKYVLELKGIVEEEEKYPLPPDFLMEVMELNENLSEGSLAAIEAFEKSIYTEVSLIIENYNDKTVTPAELQKLKEYYYKKKYLHRILERLEG
ncbi:MAG TPA: Fe-S protein assembly co-chaperone HscB [Ferruginibacter sp.]|nr:Fe-S protein assembly co-chaperone HscB [Ferruginibacter sp.]